jgi:hypothetical protein
MKVILFWIMVPIVVWALTSHAAPTEGFVVSGFLSANPTELDEGYFALGQNLTLMVRPGSAFHHQLKPLVNGNVRIVIVRCTSDAECRKNILTPR